MKWKYVLHPSKKQPNDQIFFIHISEVLESYIEYSKDKNLH